MSVKGLIISGEFGKVLARQKSDQPLEIGELLIGGTEKKILLQVTDLLYGSQISQQNLELISGISLEENSPVEFFDQNLRNYSLAVLKSLITISKGKSKLAKELPKFLSEIREVKKEDLSFITQPKNPLYIGKMRSGSKTLDVDISLPGKKVFSHHILIPATTGRGKSNLTSCILWNCLDKEYCGILVLDPHDEYYGRNDLGLKDHKEKDCLTYYTNNNPPPGTNSLRINLNIIRPGHFEGVVYWSDPQRQALHAYYKKFKDRWIEAIILEKPLDVSFMEGTMAVVKRRLLSLLDLDWTGERLFSNGIFTLKGGESTVADICNDLESAKTVIIDTSSFSGEVEILIGSLISTEVLRRYKNYKLNGDLVDKPVLNIILEEAPRVLGKDVLEKGSNIFATIAREGRKFQVGLTAITQLPSLIPRQILANMNTKIILGIEMAPERQAIIDSASQDISDSDRNIASLDIGEAIITSNFSRFATPVKIPLFQDLVKSSQQTDLKTSFTGIKK
ncbi:ATP-binding protein [Candidatus Woesearchaeota archaeon]|nr:ATP-binding protein [Candidatus Woesearchaeota archaeon]